MERRKMKAAAGKIEERKEKIRTIELDTDAGTRD
jgi:hypothetical protein